MRLAVRRTGSRPALGAVAKAKLESHLAVRVREAGDLVVDEAGFQTCVDKVGVAQRAAASFQPHDPDGAVRFDPGLQLLEALEVAGVVGAHEYDVARRPRLAAGDIGSPLAQELHE